MGRNLEFGMHFRSRRKISSVILPPGPTGYTHGDGNDGAPWVRVLFVWIFYIGMIALLGSPIVAVVVGVIGKLKGLF